MLSTTLVPDEIIPLLQQAGLPQRFRATSLPGGSNNRVYRIDLESSSVLLKAYFQHPDDLRDRLRAEFSFSRFAWDQGLRCLARPLVRDQQRKLGLYEFIEGRLLAWHEIGHSEVQQSISFFHELNRHKFDASARKLPCGSEACFTITQHLACVERRIMSLVQVDDSTPLGKRAMEMVRRELVPAWQRTRDIVADQAAQWNLAPDAAIAREDECLSPSDFGFHNAILAADGRLRFIDFEYAGWDDPAKMVCDFFCQPEVPVSHEYFEDYTRTVVADLSNPEMHFRRIFLLLPVYRIKWCCIMLNDFLKVGSRRRSFARSAEDEDARKRSQLEKVGKMLMQIDMRGT